MVWNFPLDSLTVFLVVAGVTLCGGAIGLFLQRVLPEKYTSDRSKIAVESVSSLVTLLLALVLGLLIWTAYGVFSAQRSSVQIFASNVRQAAQALADYGADARSARALLKEQMARARQQFWGDTVQDDNLVNLVYLTTVNDLRLRNIALNSLKPSTDDQKRALESAQKHSSAMSETRLKMALQLEDPISMVMLGIVTLWSFILFFQFGLVSRLNAMASVVFILGALSIGSAAFLIIELTQPYSGWIRVSPSAFDRVMADLDKETRANE